MHPIRPQSRRIRSQIRLQKDPRPHLPVCIESWANPWDHLICAVGQTMHPWNRVQISQKAQIPRPIFPSRKMHLSRRRQTRAMTEPLFLWFLFFKIALIHR
jgi:hypothetical protein